jgi:hypothetical protein
VQGKTNRVLIAYVSGMNRRDPGRYLPNPRPCVADDDRAIGRVAVRPLKLASEAVRCDVVHEADRSVGELSH